MSVVKLNLNFNINCCERLKKEDEMKEKFLAVMKGWEQSECVEFIRDLIESHPEVLEFEEVKRQTI